MTTTEEPYFFANGDYKLFGVMHRPQPDKDLSKGFVFCHPFAEEKLWVHRAYVNFARTLVEHGFSVLRIDYMGHGDSEGNFEDSTITSRVSDIVCAVGQLKDAGTKDVGLLGLRFGATLAAVAAEEIDAIDALIMWQPIVSGEKYMKEVLRSNLTGQMAIYGKVVKTRDKLISEMKDGKTVNIDGYEMSYELFTQASELNLLTHERYQGPALIIQIDKKASNLKKDIESLAGVYANAKVLQTVEQPFWTEIKEFYSTPRSLAESTVEWLRCANG